MCHMSYLIVSYDMSSGVSFLYDISYVTDTFYFICHEISKYIDYILKICICFFHLYKNIAFTLQQPEFTILLSLNKCNGSILFIYV